MPARFPIITAWAPYGTVHLAMASGYRAASEILQGPA
jgi:hypothetical protein